MGLVFRSDGPFAFQRATLSMYDKRTKAFLQVSPPGLASSDYAILRYVKDLADNSTAYIRFSNIMDSTSTTTGSIVIDGGLGVAKRISSVNMTCATAPSTDTDVIRKLELSSGSVSNLVQTLSGSWQTLFAAPVDHTLYITKSGNMVTLSSTTASVATEAVDTSGSYTLTYSSSIQT